MPPPPPEDEEEDEGAAPLPAGTKNYISPAGMKRLREELARLLKVERPRVVEVVAWAAGNGDRSENGDYIYGKKRLREIDRRVRFLEKRIAHAEVVDPESLSGDTVRFGATVTVANDGGSERTYTIVGIDEADASRGLISWVSPLGRALLRRSEGDVVTVRTPRGDEEIEIVGVRFAAWDV
jgi:transcription elongation factor GreB